MKSLRSVFILLAAFCWLQSAHAKFSVSTVNTDGGNHSNVISYVTVSSSQYVSTSHTPSFSWPTLPATIGSGGSATWFTANGTSGWQYTYGTDFVSAAHSGDIKGKNNNGGSVPLYITSFVVIGSGSSVDVSGGNGSTTWELYKNGVLDSSGAGSVSKTISVSANDQVWLVLKPNGDNVSTNSLISWN